MSNNDETRWKQRLENFNRAFDQLAEACDQESYTRLELAGLVKCFELAYEMAWKTFKDLLYYEGYEVNSPREAIKRAFESGIISDPGPWLEALESRNRLSHNYDKTTALDAEQIIKQRYTPMLKEALEYLVKRSGA